MCILHFLCPKLRKFKKETRMIFDGLKTVVDNLIAHVDALDAKLQSVKAQLDVLLNNSNLSPADQAVLQEVIDSITAEDAKVVTDTV